MEHPVYSSYKVKQDGGEVFSENGWGGFGKSQLGAWGGAQRAARSDRRQYFDNAPAIDTGVARTRLTVEFPGGVAMVADGAPINHRRVARSNETARRVARRPRRRCPSSSCRAFLCCMALLLSKIHKVSGWTVNAIWQMQPNCNFGSYLSRRLRPQWLLAVVYVILLFHISCPFLRDTLFKSCTRNFKRISGFWILDFRLLSASFWLVHVYTRVQLDIGMCLASLCTKKNVTWIGNDNWWCANLKIKS